MVKQTSTNTGGNEKKVGPVVLVILDGWGIGQASRGNAVTLAKTPVLDMLRKQYPHTSLAASGRQVGLPDNQPGNSEAGHLNLGAGRVVEQDAVRISKDISTGAFFKNPALIRAIQHVKRRRSAMHVMGLLSNEASAHACPDHLIALLVMLRRHNVRRVYLHLFTDGRDSPPHAGLRLMNSLMRVLKGELIATVMGRYYAMDRKKDWTRTMMAYDAMVHGSGLRATSPQAAITESYNRNETDEFVPPYVLFHKGRAVASISNGDGIILYNLRSDRARQLAKPFVQEEFEKMNPGSFHRRRVPKNTVFVAMTDFGPDLGKILTAYPGEDVHDSLPRVLRGFKQLYIAEAEKYAHVTFFFNGGYAVPIGGEDRVKIDSPDVPSYVTVPRMSAAELTNQVIWAISRYDFITVNYANPDMLGHTGNLSAGIEAVEYVDHCMGKIYESIKNHHGTMMITADHGNVEGMINLETGEIDTEHSANPVPFMLISPMKIHLRSGHFALSAVAPTICQIFGVPTPAAMTGTSLITGGK